MKSVITLLELGLNMANQYSITVSNEADAVLKRCKEHGLKTSQAISAAIETLGFVALARLVTSQRIITNFREQEEDE